MVLIKNARQSLTGATMIIALIALTLLVVNVIHLVWYYMRPEGIMDFFYFLKVLGVIATLIIVIIFVFLFLLWSIIELFKEFPRRFTLPNVLKKVGYLFIILFVFSLNFFQMDYLGLKFYDTFSDKYKYLKKSYDLIEEGEIKKAIEEGRKAKEFAYQERKPWPIFLLTNAYRNTESAKLLKADEEFSSTINMGFLYGQIDSLEDESVKEFKSALEIANSPLLDKRSGYKVYPLTSLVIYYMYKGDREQSDKYNIELLDHVSQADKEDIEYFIDCQSLVAQLYSLNGDEQTAAKLWIQNNELYEKNDLKKNINYLESLLKAANARMIRNELKIAGDLLLKCKELAEDRKKKQIYLEYLFTLARYCEQVSLNGGGNEELIEDGFFRKMVNRLSKHYEDENVRYASHANFLYEKILEISEDGFGDESNEFASMQTFIAQLHISKNRFQKANEILKNVNIEKLTVDQQDRFKILELLSDSSNNISQEGLNSLLKVESHIFTRVSEKLVYLTESERRNYLSRIQENIQIINNLYLKSGDSSLYTRIYNNIIAIRNIGLYANAYIRTSIDQDPSISSNKIFKELIENREKVTDLEREVVEKKILSEVRKSPSFRAFDPLSITWEKVSQSLGINEVAVEFFTTVDEPGKTSEEVYHAFLLTNGKKPKLIRLTGSEELSKYLNTGPELKSAIDSLYRLSGQPLSKLLIEPLIAEVPNAKHFLISPAGKLHQIAWASLFIDYNLTYEILGSTRIIADSLSNQFVNNTASLFGGIDYGTTDSVMKDRGSTRYFGSLKYTQQEAIEADLILSRSGYVTKKYIGIDGNEMAFRKSTGQKNKIIHLATHGYYDRLLTLKNDVERLALYGSDVSMEKCKLAFAGVNHGESKTQDFKNDGLLTAMDISQLDFSGTNLVVLSACESGLGDITDAEGVQGFSRAFALAGVQYTMVSLWSVSDKQTAELMKFFYEYLVLYRDPSLSLYKAQIQMKSIYLNPFFWAGFQIIRSR
jgi:CHAT domain-containing protein